MGSFSTHVGVYAVENCLHLVQFCKNFVVQRITMQTIFTNERKLQLFAASIIFKGRKKLKELLFVNK